MSAKNSQHCSFSFNRKILPTDETPSSNIIHVLEKGSVDETGMKLWIENIWAIV